MFKWLKWFLTTKRPSRPSMFESMLFAYINQRNMTAYIRENAACDVVMLKPSGDLKKRYWLTYEDNLHIWAILEQYAKGELLNKQQVIDQINEDAKQKDHARR